MTKEQIAKQIFLIRRISTSLIGSQIAIKAKPNKDLERLSLKAGAPSMKSFEFLLSSVCDERFKPPYRKKALGRHIQRWKNRVSMKSIVTNLDAHVITEGAIRSFGTVIETAISAFLISMKIIKFPLIETPKTRPDFLFQIGRSLYNLESKMSVDLDVGKTRDGVGRLLNIERMIKESPYKAYDNLISKYVVWANPTAKWAATIAKAPLTEEMLMGYVEFFDLFNIETSQTEYEEILKRVWENHVMEYLGDGDL